MIRLTFRHDEDDGDAAAWGARVRSAVPEALFVAAYLDTTTLEIYVEPDADADVIHAIVETLELGQCRACRVVSLKATEVARTATLLETRVAKPHGGRIVGVNSSPDGWKLAVKVRHAQYECVDRVEHVETGDTVELAAWVRSDDDDPRTEFATLIHVFSDVTLELDRPLAGRRIVYDRG